MVRGAVTKVKVCGITNLEDAKMIVDLGADALGFVFVPSQREISPESARRIIEQLPPFVTMVGVFMEEALDTVNQIAECTGLDIVQLHGDESFEYCCKLKKKVIKRIAVRDCDTRETLVSKMRKYNGITCLLDPGAGSGEVFDWHLACEIDAPLIVAGGLTPDNVREVVQLLKPYGVDVASGVESSPGKKHREKVEKFIREVRRWSSQG